MLYLISNIIRFANLLKPMKKIIIPDYSIEKLSRTMAFTNRPRLGSRIQYPSYNQGYTRQDANHQYSNNAANYDFNSYGYNDSYKTYNEMEESSWQMESDIESYNQPIPKTFNCGELRLTHVKKVVRLSGRVQFKSLGRFLALRDSHGTIQLVVPEERLDLIKQLTNIEVDSHIDVIGQVIKRPSHKVNASMPTGEVEVFIREILDIATPKRKFVEVSGEALGPTGKRSRSSVLLTSAEIARCGGKEGVKRRFNQRTHNCGELTASHTNTEVTLCGWIENKRGERFVTLRDGYGCTQIVLDTNDWGVMRTMNSADSSAILLVKGTVSQRPAHQRNTRMATGGIEVKVTSVEIVDENEPVVEVRTEISAVKSCDSNSPGASNGDENSYCERTHTCGQLRGGDVGKDVLLYGWLNSRRGTRFGNIRDGHGSTQLLVPPELEATVGKTMVDTPLESVIRVAGTVCARPPDQVINTLSTGEIEVIVKEYTVLNPAKKDLPFVIKERNRPKENLRMKYRYLDLRYSDMQYRLRLRSKVLMKMREFLINQRGFVEIETPTLFRRTPGGAQEYVVPTRTEDRFYSLVQSPQQLKQMLMVGAMDRYFQVARCYRDEGARPDRQPEFTQMDIELSFTNRESIMQLIEDLLRASWPENLKPLQQPFPVMTYHEAMHSYGSDKPDTSIQKKLIDISDCVTVKEEGHTAKALVIDTSLDYKLKQSFKECEEILKSKAQNHSRLMMMMKCSGNKLKETLKHTLKSNNTDKLVQKLHLTPPVSVVVGVGLEDEILPLMGKIRQEVLSSPTSDYHFAWVVDFPLFLPGDNGQVESAHHPFTQAHPEDAHLLFDNPLKVRGLHFDLVLNGYEVGGGSVRIHDPASQNKVLKEVLKIPTDSLQHLLDALASGAPPHGGIALGVDRLLAVMVGAESIRDVIAFPKGFDGKDPLCGAPCPISEDEKRLYHLLPRKPKDS